jgi:hypothetical protein
MIGCCQNLTESVSFCSVDFHPAAAAASTNAAEVTKLFSFPFLGKAGEKAVGRRRRMRNLCLDCYRRTLEQRLPNDV